MPKERLKPPVAIDTVISCQQCGTTNTRALSISRSRSAQRPKKSMSGLMTVNQQAVKSGPRYESHLLHRKCHTTSGKCQINSSEHNLRSVRWQRVIRRLADINFAGAEHMR
ncbi:hypothetical protein AVEN_179872-1 [Araneus ventricosus]|uniref:Uncharacterized protein n=1 Tax=Araneus ventricosus TaxID=182803 RepID=A0A4Y2KJT7_ARAVE|nr:hypothetical protein AVEN_179872-1 [Araneus ventricosus]